MTLESILLHFSVFAIKGDFSHVVRRFSSEIESTKHLRKTWKTFFIANFEGKKVTEFSNESCKWKVLYKRRQNFIKISNAEEKMMEMKNRMFTFPICWILECLGISFKCIKCTLLEWYWNRGGWSGEEKNHFLHLPSRFAIYYSILNVLNSVNGMKFMWKNKQFPFLVQHTRSPRERDELNGDLLSQNQNNIPSLELWTQLNAILIATETVIYPREIFNNAGIDGNFSSSSPSRNSNFSESHPIYLV